MTLVDIAILVGGMGGAAAGAMIGLKHGVIWCLLGIPVGYIAGGVAAALGTVLVLFLASLVMRPFVRRTDDPPPRP